MGGGGGGYTPPSVGGLQKKIEAAKAQEDEKFRQEVDRFLREQLIFYNQRDSTAIRARLNEISDSIDVDFQRMLFGGSVAKHTYVDGLSDVDALAIIDRDNTQGVSAQDVLDKFYTDICDNLPRDRGISEISKGHLAVTIKYSDDTEIQVLPAVRVNDEIRIPDATGRGWKATSPQNFRESLTAENQRLGMNLIPAIKLVKSLVSDLPRQQRPTGYHIESLAVDAVSGFNGDSSVRGLIDRILDRSSDRVLKPIADVTGQSRVVDEYLGQKNSPERRLVSQAIGAIRRRLNATTSISQWETILSRRGER